MRSEFDSKLNAINAESEFRRITAQFTKNSEALNTDRKIVITPYLGDHAEANAGVVIAIEGSPPKGTWFVQFEGRFIVFSAGKARTLDMAYELHREAREIILRLLQVRGLIG